MSNEMDKYDLSKKPASVVEIDAETKKTHTVHKPQLQYLTKLLFHNRTEI